MRRHGRAREGRTCNTTRKTSLSHSTLGFENGVVHEFASCAEHPLVSTHADVIIDADSLLAELGMGSVHFTANCRENLDGSAIFFFSMDRPAV